MPLELSALNPSLPEPTNIPDARAALEAAMRRQRQEIERMVEGEQLIADRAKAVAEKEAAREAERLLAEKALEKKKKEEMAKKLEEASRDSRAGSGWLISLARSPAASVI